MCSVRGLWIFSPSGEIILSRRYPTVERRLRLAYESHEVHRAHGRADGDDAVFRYAEVAMPSDEVVARMMRTEVRRQLGDLSRMLGCCH